MLWQGLHISKHEGISQPLSPRTDVYVLTFLYALSLSLAPEIGAALMFPIHAKACSPSLPPQQWEDVCKSPLKCWQERRFAPGGEEEQSETNKRERICLIRVLSKVFWEIHLSSTSPSLKGSPTSPWRARCSRKQPHHCAFSLNPLPAHLKAEMQDVLGPKGGARSPVLPPPPLPALCPIFHISQRPLS